MIRMMHTGKRIAIILENFITRPERRTFFSAKHSSSYFVRLNARMTRIPLSFSRRKRLTSSVSFCFLLKRGITSLTTIHASRAITGMIAKMMRASLALRKNAITVPPIMSIGE